MKSFENQIAIKSTCAKKYIALIAAAGLASFTLFAQAADNQAATPDAVPHHKHHGDMGAKRGDHMRPGMGKGHAFWGAKLDLTDVQKESLKAARDANEVSMKSLHDQLRSAHEALDKGVEANADDAMLNKLATDLASLIGQKEFAKAKMRRDFMNMLTPDQKQKLAAFEAEHRHASHSDKKAGWKDKAETKGQ